MSKTPGHIPPGVFLYACICMVLQECIAGSTFVRVWTRAGRARVGTLRRPRVGRARGATLRRPVSTMAETRSTHPDAPPRPAPGGPAGPRSAAPRECPLGIPSSCAALASRFKTRDSASRNRGYGAQTTPRARPARGVPIRHRSHQCYLERSERSPASRPWLV